MCLWNQRELSKWFGFGMITIIRMMKLALPLHQQMQKCCNGALLHSTYCLVSVQVHVRFTLCHIVGWTGKSEYYQHCHKWIINCVVPSVFDWEERLSLLKLEPHPLKIEPTHSKLSPTHSRTSEDSFHCYSNVQHNETIFQSSWKYIHHSNYGECNFAQNLKVVNL